VSSNDALEEAWFAGAHPESELIDDAPRQLSGWVAFVNELPVRLRITAGFFAATLIVALLPLLKASPATEAPPPPVSRVAAVRAPAAKPVLVAQAAPVPPVKATVKRAQKPAKRHSAHAR
jgi:hypothetical protein